MNNEISEKLLVGSGIESSDSSWKFSGKVAEKFPEHVRRSVPYYEDGHNLIANLSNFYLKDNSVCYEIGTSHGELIEKVYKKNVALKNTSYVGIDISKDMINKANQRVPNNNQIYFKATDAVSSDYKDSDLFISNYSMQFIPLEQRYKMAGKIYNSLNKGGGFILFEKVLDDASIFQDIVSQLYVEFKIENGFSFGEIISKSKSLKGVLTPLTTSGNIDMLKQAGFKDITTIMKYLNFEGFLAVK